MAAHVLRKLREASGLGIPLALWALFASIFGPSWVDWIREGFPPVALLSVADGRASCSGGAAWCMMRADLLLLAVAPVAVVLGGAGLWLRRIGWTAAASLVVLACAVVYVLDYARLSLAVGLWTASILAAFAALQFGLARRRIHPPAAPRAAPSVEN